MPTASSSSTAYASSSDLSARFDVRTLRQLASDTGTPVEEAALSANTRLSTALLAASGMVEAACTAGKRYAPADLAALTGASAAYLKDIVCDLAMGRLWMARPAETGELPKCYTEAQKTLKDLRSGFLVFGLVEQQEAGNMEAVREYAADVDERDMVTTQAGRFFGRRANKVE